MNTNKKHTDMIDYEKYPWVPWRRYVLLLTDDSAKKKRSVSAGSGGVRGCGMLLSG
jgi:hypothetical protein